jgi:glycosyltransferase involved in cell wall biosynthesis
MIHKPIISVIVPVFNVEKYIVQCINSITSQNLKEIEIIIVNDASTDESLVICKKLAEKDSRIRIIDKEINEGLYLARKSGLEAAEGIYICHVDSDDWLVEGALKKMADIAILKDVDIVVGDYYRVLDKYGLIKQKQSGASCSKDTIITKKDFIENYYIGFFGINIFSISMWARIYKKSFLDTLEISSLDKEFGLAEDLPYNIQVFPEAKSIYFMSEFICYYRFGGSTSKFNKMHMSSSLKMYDLKKEMIRKYAYEKMNSSIMYELKNCLKSYVEMLIRYKPYSYENVILEIEKTVNSIQFDEVIAFFKKENKNDLFVNALIEKNIPAIYLLVEKACNKKKFLNYVKKIGFKLLN